MKANSDKSKQSNKATRRVLAGVLCGASVLSLVLSLVMPPISQAIANDAQAVSAEEAVMGEGSSSESTGVDSTANGGAEKQISDDAENGASEDVAAAGLPSDDAEAKGAAQPSDTQPSDDETNDENAIAPATVSADGYNEVKGNIAETFTNGGKFRLTDFAYSDKQITITKDTAIDLAGHMLYRGSGNKDSFFVVENGATLTIEDLVKTKDEQTLVETTAGHLASMEWETGNGSNSGTPKSLTYFETKSTPNQDGLGTTETTIRHVVTGFDAIDAASDSGSVKHVVTVKEGGTLDLKGGMITTAANLSDDGHVIFSEGKVKIEGGYVTNGNGGGWGGGLCITGEKAGANASLEMTGGVVAGNKSGSGGGIYADKGATLKLTGGIISGNATYENTCNSGGSPENGYGGGVFTKNACVSISDSASITNNRVDSNISESFNNGLLGGGGIACVNGGKLSITGGSVTANYSHEAGGGVYAGFYNQTIEFEMTGGTIAGNVAENAEGGGLRIAGGDNTGTMATISAGENSKIYITNNKTMTGKDRGGDWGGGGVFIQKGGKLNIVKTLITQNDAGGWGGGVAACPTGETIVSHSNGAAIYNNTDHGLSDHMSAGGNGKNEDSDAEYITDPFKNAGHKDFFLVRRKGSDKTVAVVLGKMLGNRSAGWEGTCDGQEITIDPNGGAEATYMFGLEAHPTEDAITKAQAAATTIISGNYSYTHGGGIMTNGDLTVGEVSELSVYPNMRLNATKVLVDADGNSQNLEGHGYKFKVLREDGATEPSWKDDDTFDMGDCSVAGEATVNQSNGNITFDSGKDYSSGQYVFYLVEEPISGQNELDTRFDKTIYKIVATVDSNPYKTKKLMRIDINYYKVNGVIVYKKGEKDIDFKQLNSGYSVDYLNDRTTAVVTIGDSSDNPTFTNKIVPYASTGFWTPAATKVVKGGEMKEFTLQLATDDSFQKIIRETKTTGDNKKQTLSFLDGSDKGIKYSLSDITKNPFTAGDPTGRGASKTFTYYVREKNESSIFSHYKFDQSVYKLDVTMADQKNGKIVATKVTYTKIKDADGNRIDEAPVNYNDGSDTSKPTSTPTFTNTYSTSLPLSGMSGVTLTYLAGAAVLCAAAAWMHIRRKANAKGGEHRE
ncbi:Spy0128 family protein [Collinsella aerofaciens]|uniref:Spy0128 family protein n=1 Tax=Collinsella aerofaciens TaxID=74426 RepID=UPI0034A29EF0